ncbi:MAG: DNA recombination/repair protein RecA, partial [Chloroflexota bacterium]|nr:DNA recombination/repair protein RecA [Chloroflexota bacterium]
PGGRALKFYSSVRLDIRRIGQIKRGTEVTGNRTRVRVVKNKVAAPFRVCEFDLMYNEGISHEGGLLDLGLEAELLSRSGAHLSYGDIRLGMGREAAKQFLRENPDIAGKLEDEIRNPPGEEEAVNGEADKDAGTAADGK